MTPIKAVSRHTRWVTTPLAAASTKILTVEFDGSAIWLRATKRGIIRAKPGRVLRILPLVELAAVDFQSARGAGGGSLRFHVGGSTTEQVWVMFTRDQEPAWANLFAAIQRYRQAPAAVAGG